MYDKGTLLQETSKLILHSIVCYAYLIAMEDICAWIQ